MRVVSKALGYNPGRLKTGDVFYRVYADYDEETDKAWVEAEEWHVRSIRAKRGSKTRHGVRVKTYWVDDQKYVNLVRKDSHTWVKLSRKHFDWGWAPSISKYDRNQFPLSGSLPPGFASTPLKAYRLAESSVHADYRRGYLTQEQADRVLRSIRTRIKRLGNKKSKQ